MKRSIANNSISKKKILFTTILALAVLTSCKPAAPRMPQPTTTFTLLPSVTTPPPTVTPPVPTATVSLPTATVTQPRNTATIEPTQELIPLPLSEPGPYHVGLRSIVYEDPNRQNSQVSVTVWYPAILPQEATVTGPLRNIEPDFSGAPYPLILSSTKMATTIARYIVSHGFTWASVDKIDTYDMMGIQMIKQPLDILFALDQVASNPPPELLGMIDAENAGAIGYSFDGYNSFAMSGARIDPAFYLAQCARSNAENKLVLANFSMAYHCALARTWDDFASYAGEKITTSNDGLWQPMTDPRIKAVMPMAGDGWFLFGEKGLAAVDRPTMIIVASNDELIKEDTMIFKNLGIPDKVMITFIGPDHMMVYNSTYIKRMAHFAVAFFGFYLQERQDYAWYYSEEFVNQYKDLIWGVDTDH
jgi:predicted dienelactone hydrolase